MRNWVRKNRSFIIGLGLLFMTRLSFADHYRVPTGSMEPTIAIGDHIFVNKTAYDLKWPLTGKSQIIMGEPHRGDVVVFAYPKDPSQTYVKRLVGVPGDRIKVRGGIVWVNGEPGPCSPRESFSHHLDGDWSLKEDEYFMMGDNRDNSSDSRDWGVVHRSAIIGRAEFLLWNFVLNPPDISFARIFAKL